jgi:hypothetical protein
MRGHEGLVRGPEPEAHADGGRVGVLGRIARWAADMGVEPERLLREGVDARQAGQLVSKPAWDRWLNGHDDVNDARTGRLRPGDPTEWVDRVDEEYLRHLLDVGDEMQAAALVGRVDPPFSLWRGLRFDDEMRAMEAMPHGAAVRLPGLSSFTPHLPLAEHFAGVDDLSVRQPVIVGLEGQGSLRGVEYPKPSADYAEVILPRGSRVVHRRMAAPADDVHEFEARIASPAGQFSDVDADRYASGGLADAPGYERGGRVGLMERIARAAADSGRRAARGTSSAAAPSAIADWRWRPNADVMRQLDLPAEAPDHVQDFGHFMAEQAGRAQAGDLGARDLVKAFAITRASIQRAALPADRLRDAGLSVPTDASGMVRPEGAMAEWLATPAGQRYLDAAVRGEVDDGAIADAVARLAPFGKPTDIDDALRHGATALPGREAEAARAIAGVYEGEAGLDDWRSFALGLRGIGPAKQGFIGSLLGAGGDPTLDARQLLLHTGQPTAEARPYLERRGGLGALQGVDKLALRQEDMDLGLPAELEPFRQHLTHHAVWDRVGGTETTHEDVVRAMRLYGAGGAGAAVGFEGLVGRQDPETEPERYQDGGRVGLARGALERAIRAYHGSPHRFDRFDLRRIGTGEGGAAYGRGLYFAENEDVARGYRDRLSGGPDEVAADLQELLGDYGAARRMGLEEARDPLAFLRKRAEQRVGPSGEGLRDIVGDVGAANLLRDLAEEMGGGSGREIGLWSRLDSALRAAGRPARGHMYEVDLRVDPDSLLDWDRSLDAQPRGEVVRGLVRDVVPRSARRSNPAVEYNLEEAMRAIALHGQDGVGLVDRPLGVASTRLLEAGIPGIRYLDQGSRSGGAGTSNFVLFDDAPIEIVRRYARGGLADAPGYSGGGRVEALGRGLGALVRAAEGGGGGAVRRGRQWSPTPEEIEALPLLDPVEALQVPGADIRERRRAAREWLRRNLVGQTHAAAGLDGVSVGVPAAFAKEVRGHLSDQLIRGLGALPGIIQRGARYADPSAPDMPEQGVRRYHYLGARVPVGGIIDPWRVTVREQDDGRFFAYDAGSLGEVRRDPTAAGLTAEGASLSASQGGSRRAAQQGAGGPEVKPEDGEEGPVRYADGGRVGLAAQAAEVLARALREGVSPRTRQNPRGLPMDEPLRRARAESLGFDLDDVRYHGTSADADFRSFRQKDRGVWSTSSQHEASVYARDNDSQGYRDGRPVNSASRVIPVVSRAANPRELTRSEIDAIRLAPGASGYQRAQAQVFRGAAQQGHDQIDLGGGVRADLDARNLRVPHATFDPQRSHEADLLAGVGGGAAGALAAFEGLVGREEAEAPRYADGGLADAGSYADGGMPGGFAAAVGAERRGRVGLLAKALDGAWMDRLGRVLRERPVGVQAPERAAEGILRDGRFRTQFETGTSQGSLDGRPFIEESLFGLPRDLPVEQRPVYGAIRTAVPEERPRPMAHWEGDPWTMQPHYGDHLFLLRPEAKARSTYTFDDSFALDPEWSAQVLPGLNRPYAFGEVPAPEALAAAFEQRTSTTPDMVGRDGLPWSMNYLRSPYIETQTRGPVTADEVLALIVPGYSGREDAIRDYAAERRIPVHRRDDVVADRDLQRHLGLRAAGAGLGLGALIDGEDEPVRYADGGLAGATMHGAGATMHGAGATMHGAGATMHGNAPGPADDLAATQGAAVRGLQQAQRMWDLAGGLVGG